MKALTCILVACIILFHVPSRAIAQEVRSAAPMLERVLPSVVTVAVYKSQTAKRAFGFAGSGTDAAYQRVLDLGGAQSSGSGFLVERGGRKYIITNAHVVESLGGEDALAVYSVNQTRYPVRVIGGDSFYDIAVLEFTTQQPGNEMLTLTFADREPRIGDPVFAVGNPLGEYPYTVTQGIVGGKNRSFGGVTGKFGYLQSTATIIWGNSGGPLVDADGRVVGVNSRIEIRKMGEQMFVQPQINFALETPLARRIFEDVLTNQGRMRRPFFGLEIVQRYRLEGEGQNREVMMDEGPMIASVMPDGPAARALSGSEGARILRINGAPVRNVEEALGALEAVPPNSTVTFTMDNAGRAVDVQFRASSLTPQNLASLARHALEAHASARAAEGNNVITIEFPGQQQQQAPARDDDRLNVMNSRSGNYKYEPQDRKFKRTQEPSMNSMEVVAAGIVIEGGETSVWRTRTLMDLGVAIRLSALSGVVDFVRNSGDEISANRMWFSGDTSILAKTLLF
jgi:S1-C subfamily serine protease